MDQYTYWHNRTNLQFLKYSFQKPLIITALRMRKLFLILIVLSNSIWAQTAKIEGIVRDAETLLPISYVNIYTEDDLKNNLTGSISNENGEFVVDAGKYKTIFSHINYEPFTVETNKALKEIFLLPKNYVLDEIVVSNEKPNDYLKRVIQFSKSRLDKNILLKAYGREIVKINDAYTKYSDALLDYYVKKDNGKSSVIMGQHRALHDSKLDEEDEGNINNINSAFNVKDYVKSSYNFESIEKILKDKNYEFERRIKKEADGTEYEYVEVIPDEQSTKFLLRGYVMIDPASKSILEYKLYSSDSHFKNSKLINVLVAKVKINKILVWSKFKNINNQYILNYNKKQMVMYVKMGKKFDHTFDFSNDLFVYEFKKDVQIPEKGYDKKSIFEAGTDFKEDFWTKYNVFPLSESEERFIKSVQSN